MINIIKKLSDEINKKRVNQYLFFMIASILTVLFMGYYFGTFDQVSHIPFLKNRNPICYKLAWPIQQFRKINPYTIFYLHSCPFVPIRG